MSSPQPDVLHVVCLHCDTTNRATRTRLADGATCGKCKQPLFTGRPVALTGTNFDRHVSASDLPVVVDFWAPWCGPCRMMAPAYEEAAARLEPGVRLAKLDTEAEPEIAARYGIRSIPTLILFAGGREIARHSGALDLSRLLQWVESHARSVNVSEALHERHRQAEIRRHRR
jgi:thioredoxin 2